MTINSTILVVDDESHIRQVLSLKLRHAGWNVITAVDGEDALHQAIEHRPDLVITDIQMPFMSGIGLCCALLEHDDLCEIPVIVLTARGHTLRDSDTDLPNIKQVLSKPFSPRAIAELARQWTVPAPNARRGAA